MVQLLNEILIAPNAVPWIREYLAGVFPNLTVTGKLPVEFFTPTGKISVPSKALGGKAAEGFLVLERTGGGSPTQGQHDAAHRHTFAPSAMKPQGAYPGAACHSQWPVEKRLYRFGVSYSQRG